MESRESLSERQVKALLRPLNPKRVLSAQGQSHLPAFDVEAHLTRMFGFEGWDREILALWLIHETPNTTMRDGKERVGWTVTYGCRLRLTVYRGNGVVKVTDGCATGSANNLPNQGDAHDFAMKNADSYALKRAAKAWGDQFGLSLYNKGSVAQLITSSAAYSDTVDDSVPEPLSMGNDERQEETEPETKVQVVAPVVTTTRDSSEAPAPSERTVSGGSVPMASPKQVGLVGVLTSKFALNDEERHRFFAIVTGRTIPSAKDLTGAEVRQVIDRLKEYGSQDTAVIRAFIRDAQMPYVSVPPGVPEDRSDWENPDLVFPDDYDTEPF